jgi:hypothetical protein
MGGPTVDPGAKDFGETMDDIGRSSGLRFFIGFIYIDQDPVPDVRFV